MFYPAKNYENFREYRREHEEYHELLRQHFTGVVRCTVCRRIDRDLGWLYLSDTYTAEKLSCRIWSNIALTREALDRKPFIHIPFIMRYNIPQYGDITDNSFK